MRINEAAVESEALTWFRELGYTVGHTLATLRDTLLPKLLSGEIGVEDSENFIQTAN